MSRKSTCRGDRGHVLPSHPRFARLLGITIKVGSGPREYRYLMRWLTVDSGSLLDLIDMDDDVYTATKLRARQVSQGSRSSLCWTRRAASFGRLRSAKAMPIRRSVRSRRTAPVSDSSQITTVDVPISIRESGRTPPGRPIGADGGHGEHDDADDVPQPLRIVHGEPPIQSGADH